MTSSPTASPIFLHWRYWFGFGILMWLLVVGLKANFTIQDIQCELTSETGNCSPELITQLKTELAATSLFFIAPQQLEQTIIPYNYQLSAISKQLPHTLKLRLTSVKPDFRVIAGNGQMAEYTNGNLVPVDSTPSQSSTDVPTITLSQPELPAELSSPDIKALNTLASALQQHPELQAFPLKYSDPHRVTTVLPNQLELILDPSQATAQLQRWQFILDKLNEVSVPPGTKYFDIRFKLPVFSTGIQVPQEFTEVGSDSAELR